MKNKYYTTQDEAYFTSFLRLNLSDEHRTEINMLRELAKNAKNPIEANQAVQSAREIAAKYLNP